MLFRKPRGIRGKNNEQRKIVVVVDLENMIANTELPPGADFTLNQALADLMQKLANMGDIVGKFVFTPPHRIPAFEKFFSEHRFFIIACPKAQTAEGTKDTTDQTIMDFCRQVAAEIPGITHFCLCSGDADFIPMIEILKKKGMKIIIASGNLRALAGDLIRLAEPNESGGRRVFILSPSTSRAT